MGLALLDLTREELVANALMYETVLVSRIRTTYKSTCPYCEEVCYWGTIYTSAHLGRCWQCNKEMTLDWSKVDGVES